MSDTCYVPTHEECNFARRENGLPENTPDAAIIKIFESPWATAQLGPDFLGFMDFYKAVAEVAPKIWHIVDLGCSTGIQSWFFQDFSSYVGVDPTSPDRVGGLGFTLMPEHGHALNMTGQEYLHTFGYPDTRHLVIMSAMPDKNLTEQVLTSSCRAIVWYPGQPVRVRGANGQARTIMLSIAKHVADAMNTTVEWPA